MKLLYCAHCGDIVRLFREKRSCLCGKSWGHYLDDGATTVQTWPGMSLGIANPDFAQAERAFTADLKRFSPSLTMRCWINPLSEPDVKFVAGVPMDAPDESTDPVDSADPDAPHAGDLDGGDLGGGDLGGGERTSVDMA